MTTESVSVESMTEAELEAATSPEETTPTAVVEQETTPTPDPTPVVEQETTLMTPNPTAVVEQAISELVKLGVEDPKIFVRMENLPATVPQGFDSVFWPEGRSNVKAGHKDGARPVFHSLGWKTRNGDGETYPWGAIAKDILAFRENRENKRR